VYYLFSLAFKLAVFVQVDVNGATSIADVEYFFRLQFGEAIHSLALVTLFSPPDDDILRESHNAAYICHHSGVDGLTVVDVKSIIGVVSMVPDFQVTVEGDIIIPENRYFMVEAPFLKLGALCGTLGQDDDIVDNDIDNDNDD
jgi:hypothetical protein